MYAMYNCYFAFYRKISTLVALTVLINNLYSEEHLEKVNFYAYINCDSYSARKETIIYIYKIDKYQNNLFCR